MMYTTIFRSLHTHKYC